MEFKRGESFKLTDCRKTWTVIKTFKYQGREHCVAVSTLVNDPKIKRLGIFIREDDGKVYQRV